MRSYSVRFAASDLFAELLKEEGLFAAFYSVCHLYRPDQAKAGISVELPYTDLQSVSAIWYFY